MTRTRIARAITAVAAILVPSGRRAEWRAEWDGEIAERERRSANGVIAFALGAVPHAFAELRQDWSLDVLAHELRHALRSQLRNPAYALTASLLIALGVGANTTVFTLVNAVLFRAPHGVADPNGLVQLGRRGINEPRKFDAWSYPLFIDFRTRNTSFVDLAAYETRNVLMGDDADVAQVNVQLVSGNYFGVLGANLQSGRGILENDLSRDAPPVVILSDALWRSRFGADANVLGKSVRLRGVGYRVIGIAAPGFHGTEIVDARPDLWVPITTAPSITPGATVRYDSRNMSWLYVVGRLKPGVAVSTADAELKALYRGIQLALDDTVREDIALQRGLGMRPEERSAATAISVALLAMVGLVLLVTCANLAALLLARGTAREGEIGVRLAIGAGRGRVVRQLLLETTMLALLGSGLAFLSTRWTARFVEWIMPFPLAVSIEPDMHVLAYGVIVGVSTTLVFGLVPALRSTRVDLLSLLRAGSGAGGIDRGRLRSALLIAQVALSFVLLGAAGLLARSVQRASSVDPGFRTDRIVVGEIDVQTTNAATADAVRRLEAIAARARVIPGVDAVSIASAVPTSGPTSNRAMWRADGVGEQGRPPKVLTMVIDTGYLSMMGVPLLAGRSFDAVLDQPGTATSVVINESLARLLWPGESAVGQQIAFGSMRGQRTSTVIGVARDTRNRTLGAPPSPQAYLFLSQEPAGRALLHVRFASDQTALAAPLAKQLHELLPGSAPIRFQSMRAWMARGFAEVRLIGILGATFGGLALLIASAGIHGVVSYEAQRRRREFGVRLALGARPSQVHAMVVKRSARLSALGIVAGLLAFTALAPLLRQWLFGVSTFDPMTLAAITATLLVTAVLAALGPALRASRADPIDSLRAE
jgi:predicted permease